MSRENGWFYRSAKCLTTKHARVSTEKDSLLKYHTDFCSSFAKNFFVLQAAVLVKSKATNTRRTVGVLFYFRMRIFLLIFSCSPRCAQNKWHKHIVTVSDTSCRAIRFLIDGQKNHWIQCSKFDLGPNTVEPMQHVEKYSRSSIILIYGLSVFFYHCGFIYLSKMQ